VRRPAITAGHAHARHCSPRRPPSTTVPLARSPSLPEPSFHPEPASPSVPPRHDTSKQPERH